MRRRMTGSIRCSPRPAPPRGAIHWARRRKATVGTRRRCSGEGSSKSCGGRSRRRSGSTWTKATGKWPRARRPRGRGARGRGRRRRPRSLPEGKNALRRRGGCSLIRSMPIRRGCCEKQGAHRLSQLCSQFTSPSRRSWRRSAFVSWKF
uniref:Uncharacterized protein n=1 Tax=Arundo donax TaxID=35708 RepID=A0A0A8YBB7_ARUDO